MHHSMELLVLESPWNDDLSDKMSVRLFLEGWSDLTDMHLCYRAYHDRDDLVKYVKMFVRHPNLKVCYIAGHGVGGRLAGADGKKNINLKNIAIATKVRGKGGKKNKGILFGACDVGGRADKFLNDCGSRIKWVAGYDKDTPWFEGTICDLFFIEYMLRGRIKIDKNGNFESNSFESRKTKFAEVAAKWLKQDYSLAEKCGFIAKDKE